MKDFEAKGWPHDPDGAPKARAMTPEEMSGEKKYGACASCGREVLLASEGGVCEKCRASESSCAECGGPLPHKPEGDFCDKCWAKIDGPEFDEVVLYEAIACFHDFHDRVDEPEQHHDFDGAVNGQDLNIIDALARKEIPSEALETRPHHLATQVGG